jgi:hypothetical protein
LILSLAAYRFTISNTATANKPLTGISFTDVLPTGLSVENELIGKRSIDFIVPDEATDARQHMDVLMIGKHVTIYGQWF